MTPLLRIVHIEPVADWIQGLYEGMMADSGLTLEWAGHVPDDEAPTAP